MTAFKIIMVFLISVQEITLKVGESKVLQFRDVKKVLISDPSVVDVKVISPSEIMLNALSAGKTTITVSHRDGTEEVSVSVTSPEPKLKAVLEKALSEIEGVKVRAVGDRVIVEGEILTQSDAEKFDRIMKGFPDVLVSVKKPQIFLKKMVELDVKLVEFTEGNKGEFGLNWSESIPLDIKGVFTMTDSDRGFSLSIVSGLSFIIDLMALKGFVRILSNPVLTCISGEKARFTAGGEIPVPKSGGYGTVDVTWKEFGIILEFSPVVERKDTINLSIKAETSDLDPSNSVKITGFVMPAFITRKSETTVNLQEGETLVIAELMNIKERKIVTKFPGLGHIPIVGEFFKSRKMERESSRFYILVTPKVIEPGSIDKEKPQSLLDEYKKMKKKLGISLFD